MATINAARALGMENEIGSIEAGKRADLVAFDMRAPHLQVAHNPIANFVCCARGADAHTVVVNGRAVLKDGRFAAFTGVDDVIREATARGRKIAEAAGIMGAAAPNWPQAAA
jgi:5-methylthioadenosine/S-adenosylhomocysteine deaminase